LDADNRYNQNDQIIMDENGKIEARAIDEAGNISEVRNLR